MKEVVLEQFRNHKFPGTASLKTHLSSGHESQGTIDTLEVCFFHKPSLIHWKFVSIINPH